MIIIFVRLRPQFRRGNSEAVVHLVDAPRAAKTALFLMTRCGLQVGADAFEQIEQIQGMACERCLALSPLPAQDEGSSERSDLERSFPGPRTTTELYLPRPQRAALLPLSPKPDDECLGFQEEQLVHRVGENPVAKNFEGRVVVIVHCGRLGIATAHEPPLEFQRCPDFYMPAAATKGSG
jgi:hypothetical protein